jgi:hypothetical protein
LPKFSPVEGLQPLARVLQTTQEYQHIALYPPWLWTGDGPGCALSAYPTNYFIPWAYQAYRLKMTMNSGYVARMDKVKAQQYCQNFARDVQEGRFDENTIYVVHAAYMDHFNKFASEMSCGWVSEYSVCIGTLRHNALREFLEKRQTE